MVNLVAAIASAIIPGLGQVLKGEFSKFVGIWILLAIAGVLTITILGAVVGIPMALVVYLVQVVDALLER
ncbi:MAG: hypothetical protein ACOC0X_04185 [Halobacteriota archaeon]